MGVRKPLPPKQLVNAVASAQIATTSIIGGVVGGYCAFKALQFGYNFYQINKKFDLKDREIDQESSSTRLLNGFANLIVRKKDDDNSYFVFRESLLYQLSQNRFIPKFIKNIANKNAYQPIGFISSGEGDNLKITQFIAEKETGFSAFRSSLSKLANFIPLVPRTSHLKDYAKDCDLSNLDSRFMCKEILNSNPESTNKISVWQKLKAVFSPFTNDENEILLRKLYDDRAKEISREIKNNIRVLNHRSKGILQQQEIEIEIMPLKSLQNINNSVLSQKSEQDIKLDEEEKQSNQSIKSSIESQIQNISMINRTINKEKIINQDNNSSKSSINNIQDNMLSIVNSSQYINIEQGQNIANDESNFDNQNIDEKSSIEPSNIIKEANISIISKKNQQRFDSFSF